MRPSRRPAALLCAVLLLLAAAPALAGERTGADRGRISLTVEKADIQAVLRLLCERAHLNLILSDDVKGTVTLQLRNVPLEEALDGVLRAQGLGSERRGNLLRVATLKQLQEEAAARIRLQKGREQEGPLVTHIVPVSNARAADLAPLVKDTLSPRGSVSVDARTNSLIIRDVERGAR